MKRFPRCGIVSAALGDEAAFVSETRQESWTGEALRLLVQAYPTGILLADGDGCIRYCNPQASRLLHGVPGSLKGEPLATLFAEPEKLPLAQVQAQQQSWTRLLRVNTGAGEQLILETTLLPLQGNGVAGVAVLLSLPGARGQADRQHIQAEKLAALDHVVAGVAHELNNPLTVILGYTELLLGRPFENDVRTRLGMICEKAERCRQIVDNLSRFSRRKQVPKMPANIHEIFLDTLALCEYQMNLDQIRLELRLCEQMPFVRLQRRDVQSVFFSLINNAHQALLQVPEEQRKLVVSSEALEDRIRMEISDTGCGIPEDVQHKIFDPFFTTRELSEGLGLGLSVSYGITLEHHGRIWLEASQPGLTTFVLELPLEGVSLRRK
jgi:two-component system, NtrC family, sensor kinase